MWVGNGESLIMLVTSTSSALDFPRAAVPTISMPDLGHIAPVSKEEIVYCLEKFS